MSAPLRYKVVRCFPDEAEVDEARNIADERAYTKWTTASPAKKAHVDICFSRDAQLHSVEVVNNGSAFVELQVSKTAGCEGLQPLLPPQHLRSPSEVKEKKELDRRRSFSAALMNKVTAPQKWKSMRVTVSQPFTEAAPIGLAVLLLRDVGSETVVAPAVAPAHPSVAVPMDLSDSDTEKEEEEDPLSALRRVESVRIGAAPPKKPAAPKPPAAAKPAALSVASLWGGSSPKKPLAAPPAAKPAAKPVPNPAPAKPAAPKAVPAKPAAKPAPAKPATKKGTKRPADETTHVDEAADIHPKKAKGTVGALAGKQAAPAKPAAAPQHHHHHHHPAVGHTAKQAPHAVPAPPLLQQESSDSSMSFAAAPMMQSAASFTSVEASGGGGAAAAKGSAHPLSGLTVVLSGYQNPLRSELRSAALSLGAKYVNNWSEGGTHLVCAFYDTPKHREVLAAGKGYIVTENWLKGCKAQGKRLPEKHFRLQPPSDDGDDSGSDDDDDDDGGAILSISSSSAAASSSSDSDSDAWCPPESDSSSSFSLSTPTKKKKKKKPAAKKPAAKKPAAKKAAAKKPAAKAVAKPAPPPPAPPAPSPSPPLSPTPPAPHGDPVGMHLTEEMTADAEELTVTPLQDGAEGAAAAGHAVPPGGAAGMGDGGDSSGTEDLPEFAAEKAKQSAAAQMGVGASWAGTQQSVARLNTYAEMPANLAPLPSFLRGVLVWLSPSLAHGTFRQLKKRVVTNGGKVSADINLATHAIAAGKHDAAVQAGAPVVSTAWLDACEAAQRIVPRHPYLPT